MEKKVRAIVTRATPYNECDMILTLVSLEEGRLTATARGCLKPRAKLRFAAEPMNFGEYMLTGKGDRYIVIDCSQIDSFLPLTSDLSKYYAASLILDALTKLSPEAQTGLFVAALKQLKAMAYEEKSGGDAVCDFLVAALCENGYPLDFTVCRVCKCTLDSEAAFSAADGVVCRHCEGYDAFAIDAAGRAFIAGEERDIAPEIKRKSNMWLAEIVYNLLGARISNHYFTEIV